jgi:hypothetical protein
MTQNSTIIRLAGGAWLTALSCVATTSVSSAAAPKGRVTLTEHSRQLPA